MLGLNKEFKKDPHAFLLKYPVCIEPRAGNDLRGTLSGSIGNEGVPPKGDYDFDFRNGTHGEVILDRMEWRGAATTDKTNAIRARWLPWASESTAVDTLDATVEYFFTSSLAGCRFQIGHGNLPVVAHIAGNQTGGFKQTGSEWREAQAKKTFGEDFRRSRAYSSTEYGPDDSAFCCGYFSGGQWRFLGQTTDFRNGNYVVVTVKVL